MVDLHLRKEVSSYISACEHLISASKMKNDGQLSDDECQLIDYYAEELSKATSPPPVAQDQLTLNLF